MKVCTQTLDDTM